MEIVARQISGLGNQLFQYAAAKYFAQQTGANFRLAIDSPQNQVSHGFARPFLLSHFSIPVPMLPLSAEERVLFSAVPAMRAAASGLRMLKGIRVVNEAVEQRYRFVPHLPPGRARTTYLFGYWQAAGFAAGVEQSLRRDLSFCKPATGGNLSLLEQIQGCRNPVSLHVRRGDYALAVEGNRTLPLAYYDAAIRHFERRLEAPTFFVFSDDIAFTRANLPQTSRLVFVDQNDDATAHEDLRLMSACHHHILANSSFSWWGAWLNPRPGKQVFAPKFWYLTPDSYYPDLLPSDWALWEPGAPGVERDE